MKEYYNNPYQRELETTVAACNPYKDGLYGVELTKTIAYARGGGQPGDRGILQSKDAKVEIVDTITKDGKHLHITNAPIDGEVVQTLDWEYRYDFMQQHTAQHLLSGLLWKEGYATTSVHLSDEYLSIELSSPEVPLEVIHRVEEEFLRIIGEGAMVTTQEVTSGTPEGDTLLVTLRRPTTHTGIIRVVTIGDSATPIDRAACGGVHVAKTSELGVALFLGSESIRGGTRLFWLTGKRVLQNARAHLHIVQTIGNEYSVPTEEILEALQREREQKALLREELQTLWQESIAQKMADRKRNPNRWILMEEPHRQKEFIKTLVRELQTIPQGTLLIEKSLPAIPTDTLTSATSTYKGDSTNQSYVQWYLILPEGFTPSKEFRQEILHLLNGKGGGAGRVLQGKGKEPNLPRVLDFLKEEG